MQGRVQHGPPSPLPSPPPPPPWPPHPPLLPLHSEAPAYWAEDIQSKIDSAVAKGRNASVFIPPGNRLAFGTGPVTCDGNIHLSVRSTREGATLDGEKLSSMFDIKGGCSLSLYALRFVNGRSERYGGAVKVYNAGNIAMQDVSFTDCESGMVRGRTLVAPFGASDALPVCSMAAQCTFGRPVATSRWSASPSLLARLAKCAVRTPAPRVFPPQH